MDIRSLQKHQLQTVTVEGPLWRNLTTSGPPNMTSASTAMCWYMLLLRHNSLTDHCPYAVVPLQMLLRVVCCATGIGDVSTFSHTKNVV